MSNEHWSGLARTVRSCKVIENIFNCSWQLNGRMVYSVGRHTHHNFERNSDLFIFVRRKVEMKTKEALLKSQSTMASVAPRGHNTIGKYLHCRGLTTQPLCFCYYYGIRYLAERSAGNENFTLCVVHFMMRTHKMLQPNAKRTRSRARALARAHTKMYVQRPVWNTEK